MGGERGLLEAREFDARRAFIPIPLQLPPPTFIQNGYAYASPPSSPVYRQCGLRTDKRGNNSQRWPSSHLAPLARVPPKQQQQQGTSTSTIGVPTPETWRVYGYYPSFPSSLATACAVSTRTQPSPAQYMRVRPPHSHRTVISLQTPQLSSGPYA